MSDNLEKKPTKGILKTSKSVECHDNPSTSTRKISKEQRFDEMNIMATFHPSDKDYGHMKIDEPKTPYAESSDPALTTIDQLDASLLAAKLAASINRPTPSSRSDNDSDDENLETEAERERRLEFEKKRKSHYNEFQAMKLAKQLMEEEDEDEDEEEQSGRRCWNSQESTSVSEARAKGRGKKSHP